MFEAFSTRARQVVFAARFKAGQRGADMIEVGDLLLGMVIEDQGMIGNLFSNMLGEKEPVSVSPLPSHVPFFPPETASVLPTRIEDLLPPTREPVATSLEVPLSTELERVFEAAKDVQKMFHHSQIEPLHLLAAVLTEGSSQNVKLLQSVGITKEQVLQHLSAPES